MKDLIRVWENFFETWHAPSAACPAFQRVWKDRGLRQAVEIGQPAGPSW